MLELSSFTPDQLNLILAWINDLPISNNMLLMAKELDDVRNDAIARLFLANEVDDKYAEYDLT